jgi:hypothetical protein
LLSFERRGDGMWVREWRPLGGGGGGRVGFLKERVPGVGIA